MRLVVAVLRNTLYRKTLLSGVLSISSYVLLYSHQEWVTRIFTRGGWYAVFPIVTAFYFALVHGAFTSCLLHSFGFRTAAGTVAARGQAPGSAPSKDPS